jgi:hypothetical protein
MKPLEGKLTLNCLSASHSSSVNRLVKVDCGSGMSAGVATAGSGTAGTGSGLDSAGKGATIAAVDGMSVGAGTWAGTIGFGSGAVKVFVASGVVVAVGSSTQLPPIWNSDWHFQQHEVLTWFSGHGLGCFCDLRRHGGYMLGPRSSNGWSSR